MAQYQHLPIYKQTYDILLRTTVATKDSPLRACPQANRDWVFWCIESFRNQRPTHRSTVQAFSHRSRFSLSVASVFRHGVPHEPCRQHDLLCPLLTSTPRSRALRRIQSGRPDKTGISRGKFDHLPGTPARSTPLTLIVMDFAMTRPLVPSEWPHIAFLFIRSPFCSTLLSDPASRQSPCASLTLRHDQAG